jgi:hypothetical protein
MDFLKKHYEKILLGLMLAGLIGVLVFMLFYIASDKADMANKRDSLINPRVKALTNLDLTLQDSAIARLKAAYSLDLETTNKLLNPMEWQQALDKSLIPAAKKTGLQVAVVTNITPLYLIVSLDSTTTNELGARYVVKVEHQAAANPTKRHPSAHYVSIGEKANDAFALLEVKGADPANPDALVLKLVDTGEVVTISKDKPYRRVDAYAADFRYDPERKVFHGKRIGDKFSFGGVDYAVVEVNQNELILSDQSNQKKTSLRFVP